MPELPEVETVRRGLAPYAIGRTIESVVVRDARLRWPIPKDLPRYLRGLRIVSVDRRAKYLIVGFDSGDRLLLHLGMSGRLFVLEQATPPRKHDHVDIQLSDGALLRFHDPRRFGAVLPWRSGDESHPLLAGLGPEPFSAEFSADYLHALSRRRSGAVKNFLMDGGVVVGVGNIYASEALFRARIRPTRPAGRVSHEAYDRLVDAVRKVLDTAITLGGTTLRDFAGARGESGYFQQELLVYDREGDPCRHCSTLIRRCIIGQRSSYYCPRCQP
jgi:formamidopyrimidine-DNA glycosylase